MDYANMTGPVGTEENMGGTTQRLWFAPIRDFLTIGAVDPNAATLPLSVTVAVDHVFKTGKKFNVMYVTMDSGQLDDELQGDRDGKSFKTKMKGFHPGMTAAVVGAMNQFKNDKMLCLIELPDGSIRQIGSEQFYAEIMPKFSTGTNSGSRRGFEFEIESMSPRPYIYTGAISVTPAP